jgi:hypothetical protein
MRLTRHLILLLSILTPIAAAAFPAQASASISIAAGGYLQNKPSLGGAAAILSTGTSVPAVPLALQGSLLAPLTSNGGYAVTFEVRGLSGGGYGGAYVGAGAGIGDLSSDRSTGTVLTIFAGKSIAPLTSVELRLYKQTQNTGATAGFVGLRFSF